MYTTQETENGEFWEAFIIWCSHVRFECGGVCFGRVDVGLLLCSALDVAEVRVGRVVAGTVSY